MLYKKYHRNFVSQFKVGTEFFDNNSSVIVEDGPFYFKRSNYIGIQGYSFLWWILIYPNGKINGKIKKVNVIQKIS